MSVCVCVCVCVCVLTPYAADNSKLSVEQLTAKIAKLDQLIETKTAAKNIKDDNKTVALGNVCTCVCGVVCACSCSCWRT